MSTELFISVRRPYDFYGCVRCHGWVSLAPCSPTKRGFRRVEPLGSGRVVLLEIDSFEMKDVTLVRGAIDAILSPSEESEVLSKLRWMLRLDENLSEFYAMCGARGGSYLSAIGKGRLLRSSGLFEDATKVLLTVNTTWRQTKVMVSRIVEDLGVPHPQDPSLHAFPTPEAVFAAGSSYFREQARTGYRADWILALAERVGELEALRTSDLPTPDLRSRLLSFSGIGPYGAATLLMLLGRYDCLPIDSEARDFTSKKYFKGRRATDAQIEAIYENWGSWRYLGYWLDSEETISPFGEVLGAIGSDESGIRCPASPSL